MNALPHLQTGMRPGVVAYVMTHYPAVSLTFIAGEIDEVERAGGRILPVAINAPQASDLTTKVARARRDKTLYLKRSAAAVATAALKCLVRHPLALPRLAYRAVRSARTDVGLMIRRLAHLAYATLVAERCAGQGVSHIHAQFGQAPATIAWFATEIAGFDKARRSSWSFTIHGFQDFVNEAEARLDLKAATARFVVCVSRFTKSQLCRITDVDLWSRFHVIQCGIDFDAYRLRAPRPIGTPPRLIIVGRLSPEKGHAVLFQAIGMLRDRGVDVALEVVGGGPSERALRAEVAALRLEDRVDFVGELEADRVGERLARADVFCMASFSEGLPISIMEAMAVGLPVVTTWIAGIPELAVDGVTAMTVAPGDAGALAGAVERVVTDPALRARMVAAARAAVEERHSRGVNARRLSELFRESLLANGALPEPETDRVVIGNAA